MKTICVFCSSTPNVDSKILEDAHHAGLKLAEAGFDIVWGGCDMGCMGELARGVQQGKGKATGVVTQHFLDNGQEFKKADELIVVKDLRERKHIMQSQADAFLILPGGFGTLDEMFDILAVQIINQRAGAKVYPVLIMNSNGFFDRLQEFIGGLYDQNFAREQYKDIYKFVDNIEEGISFLKD
ncbi:MAG TPA: TIGR00730 family Rossman fold protein [Candidatus Paceibacterota bacterium]|nr:TIGR00730 family Rossman fold protein [Candidatus Paceibacterota bacterium]